MGYLKQKVNLGNTNGHEQLRLHAEMAKAGARLDKTNPDVFNFFESTIGAETVKSRTLQAIREAGLEGRVTTVGEPLPIQQGSTMPGIAIIVG